MFSVTNLSSKISHQGYYYILTVDFGVPDTLLCHSLGVCPRYLILFSSVSEWLSVYVHLLIYV